MSDVNFVTVTNSDIRKTTEPLKINKTKTSLSSGPPDTPVHTPTSSYIRNFYLEYICATLFKKN